jgi:hypothetical protein
MNFFDSCWENSSNRAEAVLELHLAEMQFLRLTQEFGADAGLCAL